MNQKKMSKSIGNVADPLAAIDALGIDAVRYYLLRVGGKFRDDVDWSQEQLEKHAAEIKSLLGNFFLRVASPSIGRIAAEAPQISLNDAVNINAADDPSRLMLESARSLPSLVADGFARRDLSDALGAIVGSLKTVCILFRLLRFYD
jgi:methionyl-tRNA synthetase